MKKLFDKIKSALVRGKIAADNFMYDESGDTNFISIAIILVVVIVIAVIFIGLAQDMGDSLGTAVDELNSALAGGDK